MIIDFNGRRYEVRNIRFPALLKGVMPISLRTPFRFVGINRLNRIASPTCHVGPTHVSTFDSKMVNYELNNCFHLLFKDCSEKIPVAVMARNLHGASKEVKILAGISEVLMTPISANNMKVLIFSCCSGNQFCPPGLLPFVGFGLVFFWLWHVRIIAFLGIHSLKKCSTCVSKIGRFYLNVS